MLFLADLNSSIIKMADKVETAVAANGECTAQVEKPVEAKKVAEVPAKTVDAEECEENDVSEETPATGTAALLGEDLEDEEDDDDFVAGEGKSDEDDDDSDESEEGEGSEAAEEETEEQPTAEDAPVEAPAEEKSPEPEAEAPPAEKVCEKRPAEPEAVTECTEAKKAKSDDGAE